MRLPNLHDAAWMSWRTSKYVSVRTHGPEFKRVSLHVQAVFFFLFFLIPTRNVFNRTPKYLTCTNLRHPETKCQNLFPLFPLHPAPTTASCSLQATIMSNEYINSGLPSDVFDLCIMRTVSAATPPSFHVVTWPLQTAFTMPLYFWKSQKSFVVFAVGSGRSPAVLLANLSRALLFWPQTQKGVCRRGRKRERAENERRGGKARGHGARAEGGKSVNTYGGERKRAKDKQMPEEMCLSESHTGGRGGGAGVWLRRQTTSFRKHERHRHSQTWRSGENEFSQRWQQEI